MKTAIIKTNFWLEDKVFELNSDTRYLYLCILTNPQRDITPAFKCSDRLMSAYTGYNLQLINTCREQLIKIGYIKYIDGYYILSNQDYVEPSKGRDTKIILERYLKELPENIKEIINISTGTTTGSATGIYTSVKDKDKDKVKEENKENNFLIGEVIKEMEKIDPKNKNYYGNKTQRKACEFLVNEYGFEKVKQMIDFIYNSRGKVKYLPSITSPFELQEKWQKVLDTFSRKVADNNEWKNNVIW